MEYRIKTIPQDFIVTEFPILDVNNQGEICCYILTKINLTTFNAIEILSQVYNKEKRAFGYAGLKDEDGVTIQYISCKGERLADFESNFDNDRYISFKYICCLNKKIMVGGLYGNGFNITIRKLSDKIVKNICERKIDFLYINYFDSQRFGLPGEKHVTHLLGKAIENNDIELAKYYCTEGGQKIDGNSIMNEKYLKERMFFLNSWQSYVWNEKIKAKLLDQNKNQNITNVDGIEYIIPSQESIKKAFDELSKLDRIKQYICIKESQLQLIDNTRDVISKVKIYIDEVSSDELFLGKMKLKVHFSLNKGVYATMVLKHFMENISFKE